MARFYRGEKKGALHSALIGVCRWEKTQGVYEQPPQQTPGSPCLPSAGAASSACATSSSAAVACSCSCSPSVFFCNKFLMEEIIDISITFAWGGWFSCTHPMVPTLHRKGHLLTPIKILI